MRPEEILRLMKTRSPLQCNGKEYSRIENYALQIHDGTWERFVDLVDKDNRLERFSTRDLDGKDCIPESNTGKVKSPVVSAMLVGTPVQAHGVVFDRISEYLVSYDNRGRQRKSVVLHDHLGHSYRISENNISYLPTASLE